MSLKQTSCPAFLHITNRGSKTQKMKQNNIYQVACCPRCLRMKACLQLLGPSSLHFTCADTEERWRAHERESQWRASSSGRWGSEQEREESEKPSPFLVLSNQHGNRPQAMGCTGGNVHCRTQMPKWGRSRVLPAAASAFWQAFHTMVLILSASAPESFH